MTAASRALFVAKALTSRAEITAALSKPTWCVSELFEKAATDTVTERPTHDTLTKLLKQAGLTSVERDPVREAKLLRELDTQLTFVGHISEVDTDRIEPLVRISGEPLEVQFEDMFRPMETASETVEPGNWKPVSLAAEKNGDFYILHEGLAREA